MDNDGPQEMILSKKDASNRVRRYLSVSQENG